MSDAKHTPGWELREFAHEAAYGQPRRVYRVEIVEPRFQHGNRMASRRVCQIIDFGNYADDMDYAHLIATAPDLLAELKALSRAYVSLMEAGRDRIVMLGGDCDPMDKMEGDDPALRSARAAIAKAGAT